MRGEDFFLWTGATQLPRQASSQERVLLRGVCHISHTKGLSRQLHHDTCPPQQARAQGCELHELTAVVLHRVRKRQLPVVCSV